MTNLDSILQIRDITLPTNIRIVMVFPVVMYRCESWTIKKAEHPHWLLQKGPAGLGPALPPKPWKTQRYGRKQRGTKEPLKESNRGK